MKKQISVGVTGSGRIDDIEIDENTKAGDILEKLGLQGFRLSPGSGQPNFGADEVVFDRVKEKGKIFASSIADAGAGIEGGAQA